MDLKGKKHENLTIEVITGEAIEQCRELCNELMAFQKSKAHFHPESFDRMNFDTRMKKSYEGALDSHIAVVKDKGIPVGYVFSTVDMVTEEAKNMIADWAPPGSKGFYPEWFKVPQKVGCISNLYLREQYRNLGLGEALFKLAMEWLESIPDMEANFVYVSNGNDDAMKFYLNHGYTPSHEVYGGFINALQKK
ncbi:hypothetical protein FACS1894130_11810 [Spirochaetia bacterium]|nr:hypothetical protein FACS1894130_11810 [Spirochaetia bacterium]